MIKYFRVDNTGWSGGQSWFEGSKRHETFEQAKKHYEEIQWGEGSTFWRIVEVTIIRHNDDPHNLARVTKQIVQERYLYL
jgi:hypothetical protein